MVDCNHSNYTILFLFLSLQITVEVKKPNGSIEERMLSRTEYDSLPLQNIDSNGEQLVVGDMCDLPSLHEASILYNIKALHEKSTPYSRVGDIIIAVNPFKWIKDLYAKSTCDLYKNLITNGAHLSNLAPHVYEVGSLAYRGLAFHGENQSILVSGESGAGKTETVKIIMAQLAAIDKNDDCLISSDVINKVLDTNPLLEAFGNAKTIRNDNSSRFGKYIQLQFDVEDATTAAYKGKEVPSCSLVGSFCETFLLEKTRVVLHEPTERSYHIFYQLLSAPDTMKADIWDGLCGSNCSSFRYIGETESNIIEGKSDQERWKETVDALSLIGVHGEKFHMLMQAICIVLQLGNLTFAVDPNNDDGCVCTSENELMKLSSLMGVESCAIQKALTYRTLHASKEYYDVPLRVKQAKDGTDSLAKEIYHRVFNWLVTNINAATCVESTTKQIGLLDIFGFETFETNMFEQFCINYANEKLQKHYNINTFTSVQEEYEFEGIELPDVKCVDNSQVLELIEGRYGILSLLNEECIRPNGNDSSLVLKVCALNKDIDCLVKDPLHSSTQFAVVHYAGSVVYETTSFCTKNTDSIPNDLIECVLSSTNKILQSEFAQNSNTFSEGSRSQNSRTKSSISVSSKFRSQLQGLMTTIEGTRTRYIRCLKPNHGKIPKETDLLFTQKQLQCAGVCEAVAVSRAAYPNRLNHDSVFGRYSCLSINQPLERNLETLQGLILDILNDFNPTNSTTVSEKALKSFAIGRTRVYFGIGALEFLESKRIRKLADCATAIQKKARGAAARIRFLNLRAAAIKIQSFARLSAAANTFDRARSAATAISNWARCIFAQKELERLKKLKSCILIQTRVRIITARRTLATSKAASVSIQRIWRGAIQRPLYRRMLREAEEEARVNAKIGALQKRLKEAERKWIEAEKAKVVAERRASISTTSDSMDDGGYAESVEMLEYLRNEVSQQKEANHLLVNQLQESRKAHSILQEQYTSLRASHISVQQNSHKLRREKSILLSRTKDIKQRYSKLKKAMKKLKIDCQVEVGKMVEIMIAKESESSREIAKLQAEVKNLKKGMRNKFTRGGNKKQDKKYHLPSSTSSLSGSETRHVSSETAAMTSLQRALSQSNFGSDSVSSTKMSSLAMAAMRLSAE